ncbi:unknown [Clostridium sp. CAG:632]|nr:unknown [Clostridium sp. CAG:632]
MQKHDVLIEKGENSYQNVMQMEILKKEGTWNGYTLVSLCLHIKPRFPFGDMNMFEMLGESKKTKN